MTHYHPFALLAMTTALRVFLPDLRTGTRRLLGAGTQVGLTELMRTQPARHVPDEPPTAVTSRDAEA